MKKKKGKTKKIVLSAIAGVLILAISIFVFLKMQNDNSMKNPKKGTSVIVTDKQMKEMQKDAEQRGEKMEIHGGPNDNTGGK
ncbi:hypothetical protein [Xylocopilactobacillus apicola]|uniref:Uncharacterized protein n=1 Tax=Xylocopilactobacillus apicola TaxID=2932184 RepID=A0AAU9CYQ3_9LACO|nr:hypothetical protein [Xylocopilactobacillus apicola]BDR59144.1 hypothetical protein XA3_15850 [Xylocopilactobacillus apicola]